MSMSELKMTYVYNTYDVIIDMIEEKKPTDEILDKIREFREEVPTTKEVAQEFLNNSEELED